MAEKAKVSEARAQELGKQVLAIEHDARHQGAGIGVSKMRSLAAFFATATPDEVQAATDRKLQGVPAKTSDAVFLSCARACYKLYTAKGADWYNVEILSLEAGWADLMGAVRACLQEVNAEKADAKLLDEALSYAEPLSKGDPNKRSEEAQKWLAAKREMLVQQEAEKQAAKNSAPAVAKRIAASLIEANGYEFALAVAAELEAAIYRAQEAHAKGEAVEA